MKANQQDETQASLERVLTTFYHSPEPEPSFIHDLEQEILALDSPANASNRIILNWWLRFSQHSQVLIWSAATLIFVLLLVWIFNNFVPQPTPGTPQVIATTVTLFHSQTPAPSLSPTPTPSISPTPGVEMFYTVREGDTLLSISRDSGVPVEILVALNGLESGDVLWVGRQLILGFAGSDTVELSPNTPTPVTPAPRADALTLESSSDEIRSRLLASSSLWHTLWVDALIRSTSKGEEHLDREQVWISPPDKSRWQTGQAAGDPSLLWISNSGKATQIDLQSGERSEFDSGRLLPSQLHQVIFPTNFAFRGGAFRPIDTEIVSDRQAIVVDWTNDDGQLIDRFWVDASTGVILRWKHIPVEYADASGKVIPAEIIINSVVFDVDLPNTLFDPYTAPRQEFAPDYLNP